MSIQNTFPFNLVSWHLKTCDWHIHTHLDAPRWDEVVDLRDSQSSSVWILDIKATPVLLCSIYLTSLNSLINNNRLCFAVLPRKKCFFFEDSTCGDPLRGVLQIFQVSAPRETDFVRFGFWEDLRMVLTLKKSAKQQVLLLLLSLVHLVSGVISPNWSKVRQASQMKNLGNKCVERTELANINDWGSKFRASNPVRSWCFCHETSKSFDDVGGASIRLPCSLWKRQIPEEWTPFSRRLFVPVHTQKGSSVWNMRVWNSQVSSQKAPSSHPLTSIGQFCYALFVWCDVIFRLPREKKHKTPTRQGHEGNLIGKHTLKYITSERLEPQAETDVLYNQYSVFPDLHFSQVKLMPTCSSWRTWSFSEHGVRFVALWTGIDIQTKQKTNKQQFKKCEQNVDKLTLITLTKTSTTRHQIPRSVNSCRTSLGLPSIPSITEIYGRIWVTSFSNVYSNYYLKKRQGEVAKINIQHLWA